MKINKETLKKEAIKYYKGKGVPKDIKKAIDLFLPLAEEGDNQALNYLGNIYTRGLLRNFTKAKRFYEQAVEKGNEQAILSLGCIYDYISFRRRSTNPNALALYQQAIALYQQSVEKGDAKAMAWHQCMKKVEEFLKIMKKPLHYMNKL